MDTISPERRSKNMSHIRSSDTAPELVLRKYLHSHKFRYLLHDRHLPGRPDIVLPKYRTVIFMHGCFWHMHTACNRARYPKSNLAYWKSKLDKNVIRDKRNVELLELMGWRPIVVWECELHNSPEATLENVADLVRANSKI